MSAEAQAPLKFASRAANRASARFAGLSRSFRKRTRPPSTCPRAWHLDMAVVMVARTVLVRSRFAAVYLLGNRPRETVLIIDTLLARRPSNIALSRLLSRMDKSSWHLSRCQARSVVEGDAAPRVTARAEYLDVKDAEEGAPSARCFWQRAARPRSA